MNRKVRFILVFLLTAMVSNFEPIHAQNDQCAPAAVLSSFEAAALSNELETWVQGYQRSDCPSQVKVSVRMLARSYAVLTSSAVVGIDEELHQWASRAQATSQYGSTSWSASQATGEPNTSGCGDRGTAWASRDSRGKDKLTVYFDRAVIPSQISIYQTYTPGSIVNVDLLEADTGNVISIPDSADSIRTCPRIFILNLEMEGFPPVNGVIISLDQQIGGGWNEIDAVELVGFSIE